MNSQQRDQERIRLWEMKKEAADRQCDRLNDMRLYGCHFSYWKPNEMKESA